MFPATADRRYAATRHMDVIANHMSLRLRLTRLKSTLRIYLPMCLGRKRVIRKGVKKHMAARRSMSDRYPIVPDAAWTTPERSMGNMCHRDATAAIMISAKNTRRHMETGGASSDRY